MGEIERFFAYQRHYAKVFGELRTEGKRIDRWTLADVKAAMLKCERWLKDHPIEAKEKGRR